MAIKRFKCKDPQALSLGQPVRRWANIERPALRKLEQLDWAAVLDDAAPGEAFVAENRAQVRAFFDAGSNTWNLMVAAYLTDALQASDPALKRPLKRSVLWSN